MDACSTVAMARTCSCGNRARPQAEKSRHALAKRHLEPGMKCCTPLKRSAACNLESPLDQNCSRAAH
eukprot:4198162-Amphidinium_carterae.1